MYPFRNILNVLKPHPVFRGEAFLYPDVEITPPINPPPDKLVGDKLYQGRVSLIKSLSIPSYPSISKNSLAQFKNNNRQFG